MDPNIIEALRLLSPAYLTGVVRNLIPERFYLTEKLGGGPAIFHPTPTAILDIVEGTYPLAPMGNPGDPPTPVNMGEKTTQMPIICPQISLVDMIMAYDVNTLMNAGESPIYSGDAGAVASQRGAALRNRANTKMQKAVDAIARRVEWQFAKTMHSGKYTYENRERKQFEVDFKCPSSQFFSAPASEQWTNSGFEINSALRKYSMQYTEATGFKPTMLLVGTNAGAAFYENDTTVNWRQSPNTVLNVFSMINNSVTDDLIFTLATMPDIGEIVQYSGTFTDENGKKTGQYLDPDCLYLTNPRAWRMDYGAICNFKINPDGSPFLGTRAARSDVTDGGEALRLFTESHPLPVLTNKNGVMRVKVV